jgi:hypothetical protein
VAPARDLGADLCGLRDRRNASPHRCKIVRASCFDYYYVHSPLLVGVVVFLFILAGCVSGRTFRGVPFGGSG